MSPSSEAPKANAAMPTMEAPPLWRRLLPWILAIIIVAFVLWRTDIKEIGRHLQTINVGVYALFIITFSAINLAADTFATWKAYQVIAPEVRYPVLVAVRGASYLPTVINYHVGQAYLTYLMSKRYGVPIAVVTGGTLLSYATFLGNLVGLSAVSIPFADPKTASWVPRAILPVVVMGLLYLVVLKIKPEFFVKRKLLAPLFRVGVAGHIKQMIWRLPHVLVLAGGLWIAYGFFKVQIPLVAAMGTIPIVLLVSALPLTPQGMGTRELVAIGLLTPYVAANVTGDRSAPIVAAGTAWVVGCTLAQIIIGLSFTRTASQIFRQVPVNNPSEEA
jgi:hypothetical protein